MSPSSATPCPPRISPRSGCSCKRSAERRHPLQSLTIVDLAPEPLRRRFADAFCHILGKVHGVRGGIETIAAEEQL
jgi:hypothetical protein